MLTVPPGVALRPQRREVQVAAPPGEPALATCCATSSASPAPRSAAMPAIAAPAPCCSTASRSAPAWSRVGQVDGARRRHDRRPCRRIAATERRCRQAFLAHGAAQCGICTPGMLVAATALLERTLRRPTEQEVAGCARRRALPLHRLSQDHRGGAEPVAPSVRRAAARRPARRSAPRLRGSTARARSTAREIFGADERPADALLRCAPSARPITARASRFGDLDAFVASHPGIVRVLTAADMPGRNCYGVIAAFRRPAGLRRGRGALPRRGGGGRRRRSRRRSRASISSRFPVTWEQLAASRR